MLIPTSYRRIYALRDETAEAHLLLQGYTTKKKTETLLLDRVLDREGESDYDQVKQTRNTDMFFQTFLTKNKSQHSLVFNSDMVVSLAPFSHFFFRLHITPLTEAACLCRCSHLVTAEMAAWVPILLRCRGTCNCLKCPYLMSSVCQATTDVMKKRVRLNPMTKPMGEVYTSKT